MEYSSKDLDHLGIVATMCDQIKLVQQVDALIPPHPKMGLTIGECVKLMVINGLGFTSRPLYLEACFFSSKPIGRLLGREAVAEEISDDKLGRTLDACFQHGCDALFSKIAYNAARRFNVDTRFRHLDTTSMHVHGEYDSGGEEELLISFGHSKDGRPDLKQFMISLLSSQDGDVPMLAQTIAGNTSDKTHFKETLQKLKKEISENDEDFYYVADSALYTTQTIELLSEETKWITRVPERINEAKSLVKSISREEMQDVGKGYALKEVSSTYGGVDQRWIVVYSQAAHSREEKTLKKRIKKEAEKQRLALKKLRSLEFSCEKDALKALSQFEKKLKYHTLQSGGTTQRNACGHRGRPRKGEKVEVKFRVSAELVDDDDKQKEALALKGKFIVATNELDHSKLSNEDLLSNYKGQHSVERGFRFLKDPLFLTSSVFLKNQERIVALGMIMCLCLLVYTLSQRYLREKLMKQKGNIPDQRGKPTERPTIRWVYQLFEGVHVLIHKTATELKEMVLNLNEVRRRILAALGPPYEKMYAPAV